MVTEYKNIKWKGVKGEWGSTSDEEAVLNFMKLIKEYKHYPQEEDGAVPLERVDGTIEGFAFKRGPGKIRVWQAPGVNAYPA